MLIEPHRRGRPSAPTPSQNRRSSSLLCSSFQDRNAADLRRGRRINGLQLPLHPQQVIGWLTVLIFGLATFLVIIPALKTPLSKYIWALLALLFAVHIVSHLTALLLDPSDSELRRQHKSDRIIPEFDRTKHRHVIENSRCHLCNIKTSGPRTKHCGVCNKCVGEFDHHCRWLNNCIGRRNYTSFLLCVFTSVLATVTITGLVIAEVTLYFVSPESLNLWTVTEQQHHYQGVNREFMSIGGGAVAAAVGSGEPVNGSMLSDEDDNGTLTLLVPGLVNVSNASTNSSSDSSASAPFPLEDTIFLIFIAVVGVLASVSAALLIHLCFFHIYISFLGLTTYEYIRNQREQQQVEAPAPVVVVPTVSTHQPPPNVPPSESSSSRRRENMHSEAQLIVNSTPETVTRQRRRGVGGRKTQTLSRSSSIDRIFFCSTVKGTTTSRKTSKLNAVGVATSEDARRNISSGSSSTTTTTSLKTQCVICSLIELDPSHQKKDFLCCTKIYNREKVNIKLGLDVDPEEEEAIITTSSTTTTTTNAIRALMAHETPANSTPPNKSPQPQRWRSKLYCCVTVPDSPDTHLDVCNALGSLQSGHQGMDVESGGGFPRPHIDNNVFKITLNEDDPKSHQNVNKNKPPVIPRPTRRGVGPLRKYNRLRRLLRMVKFQRNINEGLVVNGNGNGSSTSAATALKLNQVRPMTISGGEVPLSINHRQMPPPSSMTAPSPRRKHRPRADLKGYMEYLSESNTSHQEATDSTTTTTSTGTSTMERSPSESFSPPLSHKLDPSVFTKRTRKKQFRNQLSPIRESGLSNPNSPAPARNQFFPTGGVSGSPK